MNCLARKRTKVPAIQKELELMKPLCTSGRVYVNAEQGDNNADRHIPYIDALHNRPMINQPLVEC